MSDRARLQKLPPSMAERAVKARSIACADPTSVDIDDEMLPWVYDCEEDFWISFDGNYSSKSPGEKRLIAISRAKAIEERDERLDLEEEKILLWSRVRLHVLERDRYTCQICGLSGTSRLHVHHIMKVRQGGTDHLDNLITLCPKCHVSADRKLYDPDWSKTPKED